VVAGPTLLDETSVSRRFAVVLVTAVVGLTALLRLPSFLRQLFDPDEAAIATQAIGLVNGGALYIDIIDRKPPLAPWLYALSFRITGSHDLRPLHAVAAVVLIGAALLVAWEVRGRAGTRASWWAAVLFVAGALAFVPADAQAANFSQLALLPGAAAIVVARRNSWTAALGAGLLVGVATLTRQTWAIGVVPAAFAAWWHGGRRWERPVLVFVGTLAVIAAVGLAVPFRLFLHWTFTGNGSLLFDVSKITGAAGSGFGSLGLFVVGHLVLCGLLVLLAVEAVRHRATLLHRDDLDLWLWLAVGGLSVVAGFRFFGHYWMQVLPPLVLLAAPLVNRCSRSLRRVLGGLVGVTAAVFWVMAWVPNRVHRLPDPAPLVSVVRAETTPSQRVAIWGSFPEVYWESDRLPAGGLILTDFLVGKSAGRIEGPATLHDATPGAVEDYLDALRAKPPELFLDTSTADIRGWGAYPVAVVPALESFLRRNYRIESVVDGVTVYRLDRPG
jgi:hypothetical protein